MHTSNIASYLSAMAEQQPEALAMVIQRTDGGYEEYSYRHLHDLSNRIACVLQEQGITRGTRTVLMEKPGLEFFALVFALFRIEAVLIAVDPGMGTRNLKKCLEDAEPQAFIGSRKAQLARILFGWGRKTLKTHILTGKQFFPLPGPLRLSQLLDSNTEMHKPAVTEVPESGVAAILFTSGSTGVPKGVVYTHGNFNRQLHLLRQIYAIKPGEIDLATFPLFALYAPAMGMTSLIPDMDFTRPGQVAAEKIFAAIEKYGATTMFGSPALLDRCGRRGQAHTIRLPTLRRVLTAGAPVSAAILERFSGLLNQDVEIHTPYGATEALPVSSIGSREIHEETRKDTGTGKGICVGLPVPGTQVRIITVSDEPIPLWDDKLLQDNFSIGEIVVQGPQVTESYYNRPESTALAKIYHTDGRVYHRMGDLGYRDDQGRLWFCGRKSDRVMTDDRTYYSVCCEGVFNIHEKVLRTALIALVGDGVTRPALCLELEPEHRQTNTTMLKNELLEIGAGYEHTRRIRDIFIHPGFPVDIRHNAKINRQGLARWANSRQS